jgi:hypothetical protein
VRKINLTTGNIEQTVYEQPAYIACLMQEPVKTGREKGCFCSGDPSMQPFSTYVAACAYDKLHNRLYYTPLFVNQLRYMDLNAKTPSMYFYEGEKFSPSDNLGNEADHLTRMAIAANGNGYAISNDANSFVEFTTDKKENIIQLGALTDDKSNTGISVHDRLPGRDVMLPPAETFTCSLPRIMCLKLILMKEKPHCWE